MSNITSSHFINGPLKTFGQNVTLNRATKSTGNLTGARTITYGSDETIKAVFLRKNVIYKYFKEGLVEEGDAYLMAKTTDNISKNDKITANSVVYRVTNVIERNPDGATPMFDFCTLIKID